MTDYAALLRPGETPEAARRRLDRLPGDEYARIMESEAGQDLLRVCAKRARAARQAWKEATA